jgi:hypothetical protein
MLPSRPSSTTSMNVFGEVWIAHKSLNSSGISYRGEIPRFHTQGFVQMIKLKLDELKRATTMYR